MYKLIVTLFRRLSIFLLCQLYFFITQLCWIFDSDGLLFLYSRPLLWITDFCYGRRSYHIPVGVLHHPVGVNFSIMTVSLYIIPYIIYTIPEDGMLMWFGAWHQTPQTGTCLPELRNSTVIRFLVCQCWSITVKWHIYMCKYSTLFQNSRPWSVKMTSGAPWV